MGGNTQPNNN
jgi:hypothetical protein